MWENVCACVYVRECVAECRLLKQLAARTPLEGEQGLRSSDFGLRWPCTARLTVLGGMHRAREGVTRPILSFRLILNDIATQYVKITRSFSLRIIRFFSRFRFPSFCALYSPFFRLASFMFYWAFMALFARNFIHVLWQYLGQFID